jgi:23S rRNA U2552 (ribose-2'-O)-methylase RlmE/FtsJ
MNDTKIADKHISVHWLSANQSKEFKNNNNGLLAPNRAPLELKPLWSEDDNVNEPLMPIMFTFQPNNYQLPPLDRFCLTRLPDDENIKNKLLSDTKQQLNASKARLDLVNLELWNKHAYFMNPTAFVPKELKTNCNAEMCTKGWTKLYEILKGIPNAIPKECVEKGELNTLHLCEAPGSFVCCLNHYLKTETPDLNWTWYASSLQPENPKNQESWFYDMKFVRDTSDHWLYGEDGTGDIVNSRNIEYLWKKVKHPVMFITADAGAKISDDPYDQENIIALLKFSETVASIGALAPSGTLVIKFLTTLEPVTVSTMYLLNCVFEQVHVTKPVTTKETNSEVYVVCLGFKGISKQHLNKLLQLVGSKFSVKTPFILPSDMPKEFIADIEQCGKYFADNQIELLDTRLSLFGNLTREEKGQVINIRKINGTLFLKKFGVKPLKEEDRMTKKALARTASDMQSDNAQAESEPVEYERSRKRARTDNYPPPAHARYPPYDTRGRYEPPYPHYHHHGGRPELSGPYPPYQHRGGVPPPRHAYGGYPPEEDQAYYGQQHHYNGYGDYGPPPPMHYNERGYNNRREDYQYSDHPPHHHNRSSYNERSYPPQHHDDRSGYGRGSRDDRNYERRY